MLPKSVAVHVLLLLFAALAIPSPSYAYKCVSGEEFANFVRGRIKEAYKSVPANVARPVVNGAYGLETSANIGVTARYPWNDSQGSCNNGCRTGIFNIVKDWHTGKMGTCKPKSESHQYDYLWETSSQAPEKSRYEGYTEGGECVCQLRLVRQVRVKDQNSQSLCRWLKETYNPSGVCAHVQTMFGLSIARASKYDPEYPKTCNGKGKASATSLSQSCQDLVKNRVEAFNYLAKLALDTGGIAKAEKPSDNAPGLSESVDPSSNRAE